MDKIIKEKNAFADYHPVVNLVYFGLIMVFTMVFFHPLCLAVSCLGAVVYVVQLKTLAKSKTYLGVIIPIILICAIINPLFNHQGLTVLAYFPSGNPLTLESIYYGLATATMLTAIMCWFICFNHIFTSDKFIYLFGKIIPAFALIFSLVLNFVPRFIEQAKTITQGQKCLGRSLSNGTVWKRARLAIKIISILITWSFEKAIETADSMRSRGYGRPNRTTFTLYRWRKRDAVALTLIFLLGVATTIGAALGSFSYQFFPAMDSIMPVIHEAVFYIIFILLSITPLFIELLETLTWRRYRQRSFEAYS